jgi:hypothetical protein
LADNTKERTQAEAQFKRTQKQKEGESANCPLPRPSGRRNPFLIPFPDRESSKFPFSLARARIGAEIGIKTITAVHDQCR